MDQFWPDIADSYWIGGQHEGDVGGAWTPYWLNGMVPLAFQLRNANITTLPGAKGMCAHVPQPSPFGATSKWATQSTAQYLGAKFCVSERHIGKTVPEAL